MPKKLNQITVQGVEKDGKVALWERHADHPDEGEAFVVNDGKSYKVAETKAVKGKILEGVLTTEIQSVEGDSEQTVERQNQERQNQTPNKLSAPESGKSEPNRRA